MYSPRKASKGRLGVMALKATLVMPCAIDLFAPSALADNVPTGLPPSPTFGIRKFTQPMPRFDVLPRKSASTLVPAPTAEANTTRQIVDPALGGGTDPIEGRPQAGGYLDRLPGEQIRRLECFE